MSFDEAQEYWNNLDSAPSPRRKRVFVSYPFASDPRQNKLDNLELMYRLRDKYTDCIFVSPLLLFDYLESDEGIREDIMSLCKGIITYLCDEVWSFGDSEGCMLEREYAKRAGVPVFIKRKEDI